MGYRSDFELYINAANPVCLTKFETWLGLQATNNLNPDYASIVNFLMGCKDVISDTCLAYREYSVKCYDPFENVINDIFEFCKEENGLDCAYARIGEDYTDVEVRGGLYTSTHIERTFGDYTLATVPEPDDAIPTPVVVQPKRCDCGGLKTNTPHSDWCELVLP